MYDTQGELRGLRNVIYVCDLHVSLKYPFVENIYSKSLPSSTSVLPGDTSDSRNSSFLK